MCRWAQGPPRALWPAGVAGTQTRSIQRCQLRAQLLPRGFVAVGPPCFLGRENSPKLPEGCLETPPAEEWRLGFMRDGFVSRKIFLFYFNKTTKAAKADCQSLQCLGTRSQFQKALRSPSCPSLEGGSSSLQASLAWVCRQPHPVGRAHCWPESPGKGGDLVLAAFEKAQGGQRTGAQSFWESQPQA